ncbi:hypothetical protein A6V36_20535 [Paraburkholderia ginsengiterrae]|uniref:Uncharacterized protein n=1 Tax=Paraburkholderia ginsengiterrae TaxID=1462993 RepID=A0A1A9NBR8_9BURK|nr:hypothetical protein [Paraburkholderia ginsengiterrae]OAJ62761.1 hypothetical protein A6V36_20535 [Paraburkholderia ginsengiterrae]OAJ64422.1 hypothetical protein A6V37_19560 [Paraburkholderia ginsengiterrae]
MANAVEKLFDSVLAKLPPESTEINDESNADSDRSRDIIDEPLDSESDEVHTLDFHDSVYEAHDALHSGRSLWELPPEADGIIEGGIRRSGFDVLAFFKSRRHLAARPFPGRWGIFYLRHGLLYVEAQIARAHPGFGRPRDLARQFLRMHEHFHYQADLQTLMFEAVKGRQLHQPLRRAFRGLRDEFVEEALANRQVWTWAQKPSVGIDDFAYDFMKLQPNAYARFDEPGMELTAEWAANVVDTSVGPDVRRYDLAQWVEALPQYYLRPSLCPEYVVYPAESSLWLSPALVLPKVTNIAEGREVTKRLKSKFAHLEKAWRKTKQKLLEAPQLHGLNLKPWPKDGPDSYSVKVDESNRAHLRHEGNGRWTAYIIGTHKELEHG